MWCGVNTAWRGRETRTTPTERRTHRAEAGGDDPTATAGGEEAPAVTGGAPVTMAAGDAATATAVGAQAPSGTGAGAAAGGVIAGEGAASIATEDTAEAALGAAIKVETGGVTVGTVDDTGDIAPVETGVTPDVVKLISINSHWLRYFPFMALQ